MSHSVCRMCGACERRNGSRVAVSDILRYSMYCSAYGLCDEARALYAALPGSSRVDAKRDLVPYERACPYGLPVADMLGEAHRILS